MRDYPGLSAPRSAVSILVKRPLKKPTPCRLLSECLKRPERPSRPKLLQNTWRVPMVLKVLPFVSLKLITRMCSLTIDN